MVKASDLIGGGSGEFSYAFEDVEKIYTSSGTNIFGSADNPNGMRILELFVESTNGRFINLYDATGTLQHQLSTIGGFTLRDFDLPAGWYLQKSYSSVTVSVLYVKN